MYCDAAKSGHVEVLEWLLAQDPPCPWDENACEAAAQGGQLAALQWLRAQDPPCPWDKERCLDCASEAPARQARCAAVRIWIRQQPDA